MNDSEEKLERLQKKFWAKFQGNPLAGLHDFVSYPGGFKFISEREAIKEKITGLARTVRIRNMKGEEEKIINPCFEIRIVKERFVKLTDEEILFLIAHELSHAVMNARNSKWSEDAADVLAEHYFGIKNPKGSKIGYLYEEEALEKILGIRK